MTVQLLPNREIFDDVYPESDDESAAEDESDQSDEQEETDEELEDVQEKIVVLMDEQRRARELVSSSESRQKLLETLCTSALDKEDSDVNIEASIETYRKERERAFQDHFDGSVRDRQLTKEMVKLSKELDRLQKLRQKELLKKMKTKVKAQKAKNKVKSQENQRRAEQKKEKARIRRELEKFWPRSCYTVRITLDATSFSPSSSRRTSIASVADVPKDAPTNGPTCTLSLSYVTSSASWSPSYDLSLSTTANSASLCFDAQLTNNTSETWSNCKLIISTSQATFAGLRDDIPVLRPWRLMLAQKGATPVFNSDVFDSREERDQMASWRASQNSTQDQKHRSQLLGLRPPSPISVPAASGSLFGAAKPATGSLFGSTTAAPAATGGGLFGNKGSTAQPAAASLFGAKSASTAGTSLFGSSKPSADGSVKPEATNSTSLFDGAKPSGFGSNPTAIEPSQPSSTSGSSLFSNNVASSGFGQPGTAPSLFGSARPAASESDKPAATAGSGLFGSAAASSSKGTSIFSRAGGLFGNAQSAASQVPINIEPKQGESGSHSDGGDNYGDEETNRDPVDPAPEMNFQESSYEETGMTATYDLPGLKTLKPSLTPSKQRVARISFTDVVFSHTVVAKYRPAAYLKAKVHNTSKLTLLKGPTGLTLDGSFMGRSDLPRCGPGDNFILSLGVDPTIDVTYLKPAVKRSTAGFFTKGGTAVYTRIVMLRNKRIANAGTGTTESGSPSSSGSKPAPPASITVLDQVPVSEDEKIKIEVLQPKGLATAWPGSIPVDNTSPAARTSLSSKDQNGDWGSAKASFRSPKLGEVQWDVELNAGKSVRLMLEYEITFPTDETVVQPNTGLFG